MAMLLLSACAVLQPEPAGVPEPDSPLLTAPPDNPGPAADSRMVASHSLTRQGYRLLREKNYDGAIRLLERAVGINPSDGRGYFYLAEAWLKKHNLNLAAQFNSLAALYLRDDPAWSRLAGEQKERIVNGERSSSGS